MSRKSEIRAARVAARQEAQELIAGLRRTRAQVQQEREAYRRERAHEEDETARARRRGEHGPDLQTVQRRIDAGELTWDAVLSGRDDHPASLRVRDTIHQNLDRLSEGLASDPELVEAGEEARRLNARIERESQGF